MARAYLVLSLPKPQWPEIGDDYAQLSDRSHHDDARYSGVSRLCRGNERYQVHVPIPTRLLLASMRPQLFGQPKEAPEVRQPLQSFLLQLPVSVGLGALAT
jgi:hypothetical protein